MKKQSRETVDNILDTAVRHFAEKGYEGARIDEIAEAAGVNKAALYYHIGNKSELYEKVIDRILGGIADRITENIKKAPTNQARLYAFVTTLAQTIIEDQFFAPMMMREVASGGSKLPDTVMLQMMQVFGALFLILEEGRSDGQFRPVNPLVVYMMIIGGLAFYVAGASVRGKISSLGASEFQRVLDVPSEEAMEYFAEMMIHAVAA